MADDLEVNSADLRGAAASSDGLADGLAAINTGSVRSHPSSAGIAALDTAIASVRSRQSTNVAGDAGAVSNAGARYDDSDGSAADDIAVTM